MARILVTGGAGFMGRWVAHEFVKRGCEVWVLDNLSNGAEANIAEFKSKLGGMVVGDVKDRKLLADLFACRFEICVHCAAAINVQESIDCPERCVQDNVIGTFNVLEECRKYGTRMVFISSALVYMTADDDDTIREEHPLHAACPYAASKIAGENFTLAYHASYGLPAVILRPFSIYGPWQRSDSEGGVVSIFIDHALRNQPVSIYGDGEQSRDFFYVEECATFVADASFSKSANGRILNAGSGSETRIKDLALKICGTPDAIKYVKHHHAHAEIMHMRADSTNARRLLGWCCRTSLDEGLRMTREWLAGK